MLIFHKIYLNKILQTLQEPFFQIIQQEGMLYIMNNNFCENMAFTQYHILLGSGAVFNLGGSMYSQLISYENLYYGNVAEFKGL